MRSPYSTTPVFTGTEIEMLLYAWDLGTLQTYEDTLFDTRKASQAFYR